MNNKHVQKLLVKYVVASRDLSGEPVYLRSLRDHKWELVGDIEIATKTLDQETAEIVMDNYYSDLGTNDEDWFVIPVEITWSLIEE